MFINIRPMKKLLLFDIDGTLIECGHSIHSKAFEHAIRAHTGKTVPLSSVDPDGKTDSAILLTLLRHSGMGKIEAKAHVPEVFETMVSYYLENEVDLRRYVLPGVIETLDLLPSAGHILPALLTGNHEAIAWHKLKCAGLDSYFKVGGFGNESFERHELLDIALRKCEGILGFRFERDDIIIIGDTPRDVDCARRNRVASIAVATGRATLSELESAGADLVLESLKRPDNLLEFISLSPKDRPRRH